jgi:hypothetical protein
MYFLKFEYCIDKYTMDINALKKSQPIPIQSKSVEQRRNDILFKLPNDPLYVSEASSEPTSARSDFVEQDAVEISLRHATNALTSAIQNYVKLCVQMELCKQ